VSGLSDDEYTQELGKRQSAISQCILRRSPWMALTKTLNGGERNPPSPVQSITRPSAVHYQTDELKIAGQVGD
jgi:hypothetical protein